MDHYNINMDGPVTLEEEGTGIVWIIAMIAVSIWLARKA